MPLRQQMMLRKQAIREVGLFDERFEPGMGEDYDYVLSVRKAGWRKGADGKWVLESVETIQ